MMVDKTTCLKSLEAAASGSENGQLSELYKSEGCIHGSWFKGDKCA